jgi:hypothetical protein
LFDRDQKTKQEGCSMSATSIDDLDLAGSAKAGAAALLALHPNVVFTSGRRNIAQQASAMAGNVAVRRGWIKDTYAASPERDSLQDWIDAHPAATTKQAIAAGLTTTMNGWSDAQKARLSRHFSGQAFDVRPVAGAAGDAIKADMKNLADRRKFFDTEGGLTIWHVDFNT